MSDPVPPKMAPLLRPIRSGNAFEETTARLLHLIRLGSVRVGERLPSERSLAVQLGVSRTTLREAIGGLQRAGYLEVRRGRYGGAYVIEPPRPALAVADATEAETTSASSVGSLSVGPLAGTALARSALGGPTLAGSVLGESLFGRPTAEELDDALRFRAIVDVAAAGQAAAAELSEQQVAALRQALAECTESDDGSMRQLDSRLHLLIAECTGIPSLLRAVADVRIRINQLLDLIPLLPVNLDHSHEQHRRLVEAVIEGRVADAERVATEHLAGTESLLRGFLGHERADNSGSRGE